MGKKELELKEKRLKHKMERIRYTIEENNNIMSRYDHKIETSLEGIEHLSKEKKENNEREKLLLFKRHKAVRFLISPKIKKVKIEVNKIMNPAFLLGTAFNIAYWHRKYHSGTICKGVSNPQTSNALSGCEKEEIPK